MNPGGAAIFIARLFLQIKQFLCYCFTLAISVFSCQVPSQTDYTAEQKGIVQNPKTDVAKKQSLSDFSKIISTLGDNSAVI